MYDPTSRLDDVSRVFFAQQLVAIDEEIYSEDIPEFKARRLVPTIDGVDAWARAYLWNAVTDAGKARLASSNADDVPVVGTSRTQNTSLINKYWSSYIYEDDEILASAKMGYPLDRERARACRRAVEQAIDEAIAGGDPATGSTGLLNQPGATVVIAGDKAAGGKAWGTLVLPKATGEEVARDIMALATTVANNSKDVINKLTILLPIEAYAYAAQVKFGNATDSTALQFAEKSPYIESIEPWFRTSTAGAGSGSRMVAYPRAKRVLGALVPQEYTVDPPLRKIHKEQVIGWAKCGGVVLRYANAVGYMDGI